MNFILLLEFFVIAVLAIIIIAEINKKLNIQGIDINKKEQPWIPESVGIALLIPLWSYITVNSFYGNYDLKLFIFGLMVSVFSFLGFIDDLKPKFVSKQQSFKLRALLSGSTALIFAYLLFPENILIAFIFIIALISFQNSFAGLNGWEVGSGFILSLMTLFFVPKEYFFLATMLSISILALLLFNVFPARVFPGDSGTFFIGSAIAGLLLFTKNTSTLIEFLFFYLPHFIDFFILKLLSNPRDVSQTKERPYSLEGNLLHANKKSKTLDFAKLLIKIIGPQKELTLVLLIWIIVLLNALFWLFFFRII